MEAENFIKAHIEIVALDKEDIIVTSYIYPGMELPDDEW